MKHLYYFLALNDRFEVIRASAGTDRVGLIGASFTTVGNAADYVEQLNREEKIKPDSDTDTD